MPALPGKCVGHGLQGHFIVYQKQSFSLLVYSEHMQRFSNKPGSSQRNTAKAPAARLTWDPSKLSIPSPQTTIFCMILYWRIPVGSPHVSSRNVIVHNVNILILANIYPLLEGRLFLSLSHHFKQIQMNVLSCLRKGNDQSGLYPMTTSGSIWHTTNSIWM